MKRILIAIALLLFAGSILGAQTCTPVYLAKTNDYNDHSGPTFALGLGGNNPDLQWRQWSPGAQLVTQSTELWIGDNNIEGYVNVRPGIGGCLIELKYELIYHYEFEDLTTRRIIATDTRVVTSEQNCGFVASCKFSWDDPPNHLKVGPYAVSHGHTYQLTEFAFAEVTDIPADTPQSSASIQVRVE